MMNVWQCDHEGCESTCVGIGGAVGLVAIGWYFKKGNMRRGVGEHPITLCPIHHPEGYEIADRTQEYIQELLRFSEALDRVKRNGV